MTATNGKETKETAETNAPAAVPLGESLKKRRLQRGLTFDMIGQDTRISQRFLKAIEEEQWAEFPAKVYLEGFLRQYAAYLGFDGGEFVLRFREIHGEKEKPALTQNAAPKASSVSMQEGNTSTRYGLAFFLIFAAGVAGLYFLTRRDSEPIQVESVTAPIVPSTATAVAAPARERDAATAPAAAERPAAPIAPVERTSSAATSTGSHRFQVTAQGTVWMRAWVDGQVRFEGIVRPGTVKTWSGKESFRLEGANFGLLDVAMDGATLRPSPEKPGEISWSAATEASAAPAAAPKVRRRAPSFVSPLPGPDSGQPSSQPAQP